MPTDEAENPRRANFLQILKEEFNDKPSEFEKRTGYKANMVSQIKGGTKPVGDKLARKFEKLLRLPRLSLDRPLPNRPQPRAAQAPPWPLSVSRSDFESLSPKAQRDIDEAFTRMVLGAQAQDLLEKQQKRKS